MQALGRQLLARAAFSKHQHRTFRPRRPRHIFLKGQKNIRCAQSISDRELHNFTLFRFLKSIYGLFCLSHNEIYVHDFPGIFTITVK